MSCANTTIHTGRRVSIHAITITSLSPQQHRPTPSTLHIIITTTPFSLPVNTIDNPYHHHQHPSLSLSHCRGQTVCDALGVLGRPGNVLVCERMDVDGFWQQMAGAVDRAAAVAGVGDGAVAGVGDGDGEVGPGVVAGAGKRKREVRVERVGDGVGDGKGRGWEWCGWVRSLPTAYR